MIRFHINLKIYGTYNTYICHKIFLTSSFHLRKELKYIFNVYIKLKSIIKNNNLHLLYS